MATSNGTALDVNKLAGGGEHGMKHSCYFGPKL